MKDGKTAEVRMMDYDEVLEYLYQNLPMFQRQGEPAYKPGLENTVKLLKALGDPQKKFRSVHIAGTNGKGSVAHMLCSSLMESGYKTGLYTSPHMFDYRERIRIQGKKIKKRYVTEFVNKILPLCDELKPSFFEVTVALAFHYFARKKVEVAVVETGMGGRLDSTNVLIPDISVITNIGYDHTKYLGKTLSAIASEKAGIIKKKIPVIIGESQPETKEVFLQKAKELNSPLWFADLYYSVSKRHSKDNKNFFMVKKESQEYEGKLETDLGGMYQLKNIATVYMARQILNQLGYKIKKKHIKKGIGKVKKNTDLLGRWEVVRNRPKVIMDTGHNPEGIREIVNQLKHYRYNKLYIIFGTVNDKEVDKVLEELPREGFYLFTKADMPRSMEINTLFKAAQSHSLRGITCANVKIAYMYAINMAKKSDLILVTGSSFIVSEALKDIEFK